MNVSQPPFDDLLVRQALNYAVDKELIIEALYGGRAVAAARSPLTLQQLCEQKSRAISLRSGQSPVALLAEAGWTDSDGDGMLDKEGQPLAFTIDTLERPVPHSG